MCICKEITVIQSFNRFRYNTLFYVIHTRNESILKIVNPSLNLASLDMGNLI
jgi:hypothetical protein